MPDPPLGFSLPSHPQHPPLKLSLLPFTTQLTGAFLHPQALVIKRLTLVTGGALKSSESLHRIKRTSSGGEIDQNCRQPYS